MKVLPDAVAADSERPARLQREPRSLRRSSFAFAVGLDAMHARRPGRLTVPVTDRDNRQGSLEAALILVEYGDFECSHCGQAYWIVKRLQSRLRSRLCFVFRSFPLADSHPHAQHAAEAAEAAASQGRFWEMHDQLFEHQRALSDRHLVRYATEVGLDIAKFEGELVTHSHAEHVRQVFMGGVESGVHGTPTFFVNGIRHDESWDYDTLLSALRAAS